MALAPDRLWRHFTPARYSPIVIERGEGCYIWDTEGNRYLDSLAALYCVNIGYGPWPEIAEAAAEQLNRLPFFTNWVGFATPPALELSEKLSTLVPIDVGRIFFVSGGSEAVETALKLARQYHRLRGEPTRYKFVTRRSAYHGTTMGALSVNGNAGLRAQFEPLLPGCLHAPLPYRYRCPYCSERPECTLRCADEIDDIIRAEDAQTVAAVLLEPVQNSGGSITPPPGYFERVREICDEHGVLLVADEVICGFGRVGDWFGSTRYGIEPDVMTIAKGITSAYAPLGAVVASEKVIDPFFEEGKRLFVHGITFGGHPLSCAIALANLEIMEREDLVGHVQRHTGDFRAAFDRLRDEHPMVGDVRGDGFFYSLELVKDKETKATFTPAERDELIKTAIVPRARELGVYMRVDDRAETAAQFSPPLVAGPAELDEFLGVLRQVLDEAWEREVWTGASPAAPLPDSEAKHAPA
jgi:adenosylmethionine-8-amino-7-oxononanoate aminotransferase